MDVHKNYATFEALIGQLAMLSTNITAHANDTLMNKSFFMQDYRTIGITVPRQTGLTHFQLKQLIANKDAWLIMDSEPYRETLINNSDNFGIELGKLDKFRILTKEQLLGTADCFHINEAMNKAPMLLMIDMSRRYTHEEMDRVYSWMSKSTDCKGMIVLFN